MKKYFFTILIILIILSCNPRKPDHYGVYLNDYKTELKKYRFNNGYEGTENLPISLITTTHKPPKLFVYSSMPVKENTFELWGNVKRRENGRLGGEGTPKLFQIKKLTMNYMN